MFQDDAATLRDQLCEGNRKYEQLLLSYTSVDQKLRNITLEKDQCFETNEKMSKEKILLEGRLTTATEKIVAEEERNRQSAKLRAKLETKIADYEEENAKIKKVRKSIITSAIATIYRFVSYRELSGSISFHLNKLLL
ncbi:unnamed protein product [Brugia pahangi]|uniref:TACC_C domain-containing protein n=1 Tax=Brugia pahangi TaxID=6280 RepID=A0A0N4T5V8_BRUPA|nr:unnamed protein product [Brugia pahangi]